MPGSRLTRRALVASLLLIPALLVLTLWAWRGLDESLASDRHRVQRFEELAASHVVNGLGSELFFLHLTFGQGLLTYTGSTGLGTTVAALVDRYRAQAHDPELLSEVLIVHGAGTRDEAWLRWTPGRWTSVGRPAWVDAGVWQRSDDMIDLERPYAVFRLGDRLATRDAVVVRYSVNHVLHTLVPRLAAEAFQDASPAFGYRVTVVRQTPGASLSDRGDLVVPLVPLVRFSDWLVHYLEPADRRPPEAAPVVTPRWSLQVTLLPDGVSGYVDQRFRQNLLWVSGLVVVLLVGFGLMVGSLVAVARSSRRERAFSSLVSHELKTPLAAIKALAENLSDGVVQNEGRVRQYGGQILDQSRRLSQLVGNILTLSVLGSDPKRLVRNPLDLAVLARGVAERAGVPFVAPPGSWTTRGNESALGAALDNLVTNALRYGVVEGESPRVEVAMERRRRWGRWWIGVSVSDQGPGLSPADLGQLFVPLRPGRGVGLSLVRTTLHQLGGQVQVQTSPGRGLKMTLWLKLR